MIRRSEAMRYNKEASIKKLTYIQSDGYAYIEIPYDLGQIDIYIKSSNHGHTVHGNLFKQGELRLNISTQAGAQITYNNVNIGSRSWMSGGNNKYFRVSSYNGVINGTNSDKGNWVKNIAYTEVDSPNKNIYLWDDTDSQRAEFKIEQVIAYDIDGGEIMNLIPAEIDGQLGFYDKISDAFHTNAGEGEFIAGDTIVN